jgi:ribosome-associated toxin RatA of RatAB toxin-antitoxin module
VTEIHRTALLPYPAEHVFAIVDDVERYPDFLPWCDGVEVRERSGEHVVATLKVRVRGVRESFTTENRVDPGRAITMQLVEGPFRSLAGQWRFHAIGANEGCRVELDLRFAFGVAGRALARAFPKVFTEAADQLVDAFCRRAHALLG